MLKKDERFMKLLIGSLQLGLLYGILALGIYISFRILSIPDLTTEGSFAFGLSVSAAVTAGLPVPAFSSALAYCDGYRSAFLPANLIQAQRDYFGAHTYERTDSPRGEFFHTNWTGEGGDTVSGEYTV